MWLSLAWRVANLWLRALADLLFHALLLYLHEEHEDQM